MTPLKKTIMFAMLLITFVTFVKFISLFTSDGPAKYTIYAADKLYYCNEFNVSGNTIYFKDLRKKNVCINGNYTLIYETEEDNKK